MDFLQAYILLVSYTLSLHPGFFTFLKLVEAYIFFPLF